MSSSSDWISVALDELARNGLLRRRRVTHLLPDRQCKIDSRPILDFASNDYLDLSRDPRVIAAAVAAIQVSGIGARASALVCGRTQWHVALERCIAEFEKQPDAILFPSGMAANVGTVTALCGSDDLILCDRFNHASLVDGCRLSQGKVRVYRHDDLTTVEREFKKAESAGRRWIVTDSVFSMDGDLAPLKELCDLAERWDAHLIVDEAHATGVFGEHGRGVCELAGVEDRVAVRVGTLSKAIGAQGGFVAGPTGLIELLWNRARTQVYSTALSPAVCAAATTAFQIISSEPSRRTRLQAAAESFRQQLRQRKIQTFPGSIGPIVPVVVQDPLAAMTVAQRLEEQGFLVGAIRPPTVPRDTSRLRIVVTHAHHDEDLSALALAVGKEIEAVTAK